MKSIKEEITNEIVINKSKFITILTKINNQNEVKEKLKKYKKLYKNATHYCSAYIIGPYAKCDDDGEPSGTAGMPILNVLKNHNLTNILCLVIRYFGGIKLGAGGLVRAYSKSVSSALNKSIIFDLVDGYYVEIEFTYDEVKTIDYLLKDLEIKKDFKNNIIYKFEITKENFSKIENNLKKFITKKEPILVSV